MLRKHIQTDSLIELVGLLRDFKARGGTKEAAYEALAQLRAEVALNEYEDRTLDLMDVVEGFCSPHMLVWE